MTPVLEVDVDHRVGDFRLQACFGVESGTAVLFGPSGAGKSLTVALVAGLVRPSEGSIRIGGELVADAATGLHVPTQRRRIGMVFQDGLLLPHRTALENVVLAVREPVDRADRRRVATEWLDRVGAAELADRRPGSLSGGQRQRVALARGLAGSPALLLLDEPLSSLDVEVRVELQQLIRDVVTSTSTPTLVVTHDHAEALSLGDVIITYEHGRVVDTTTMPTQKP